MSTDRYFDIQLDSKRGRRIFVKLKHDERGTLMLGPRRQRRWRPLPE